MERNETEDLIWVKTASKHYPVLVGRECVTLEKIKPYIKGQSVFIITNETIASFHLDFIESLFSPLQFHCCVLPDGESYKNIDTIVQIIDAMINASLNRDTTVIAFGGGVIGDMAGFAASCYQRGVDFIQMPTSLLAIVDAAIGGKTGVNHQREKNVIGSFYQPNAVCIDTALLKTLPSREYVSGLAEVIKYALLGSKSFFQWLEANLDLLLNQDPAALIKAIKQCIEMKADIVAQDEREGGIRAILNLGHTFAHALESATDYEKWLHGEAVAIGLHAQARLSAKLGYITEADVGAICALIKQAGLPLYFSKSIDIEQLMTLMQRDKKVSNNSLKFVLLKTIGQAFVRGLDDLQLAKDVLIELAVEEG